LLINLMKAIIWIFLRWWQALASLQRSLSIDNWWYFTNFRWMQKTSNALWSGGGNASLCSQMLVFWLEKYWGLLVPKLKLKQYFPLLVYLIWKDVIYNFKNLENFIFMSKNWPNDVRVGCKAPSSLVVW
jgi:hypothetical protein